MGVGSFDRRADAAFDAIAALDAGSHGVQDLLEGVIGRIVSLVRPDAFWAGAADPHSGLSAGPGLIGELPAELCGLFWQNEVLTPDFNKFGSLTPANPLGDLRRLTKGNLARSARFRWLSEGCNVGDEVRVALHANGHTWGFLQLNRENGAEPFSDGDLRFLGKVAPLAGRALSRSLLMDRTAPPTGAGPGFVLIDSAGTELNWNEQGRTWLDATATSGWWRDARRSGTHPMLTMLALNAVARGTSESLWTRVRTEGGVWLSVQCSPLMESGDLIVVMEPASAEAVSPIVIDASGLTAREHEVTQLVIRGATTEAIASELSVSAHTVRDHVKAIFGKLGVRSRGELTAYILAPQVACSEPPPNLMERAANTLR